MPLDKKNHISDNLNKSPRTLTNLSIAETEHKPIQMKKKNHFIDRIDNHSKTKPIQKQILTIQTNQRRDRERQTQRRWRRGRVQKAAAAMEELQRRR